MSRHSKFRSLLGLVAIATCATAVSAPGVASAHHSDCRHGAGIDQHPNALPTVWIRPVVIGCDPIRLYPDHGGVPSEIEDPVPASEYAAAQSRERSPAKARRRACSSKRRAAARRGARSARPGSKCRRQARRR